MDKNSKLKTARKNTEIRRPWYISVFAIILAVVFTTSSAVSIPASTLEKERVYCGLTEHTHTEACYSYDKNTGEESLKCGLTEHTHNSECYVKETDNESKAEDSDTASDSAVDTTSEIDTSSEIALSDTEISDTDTDSTQKEDTDADENIGKSTDENISEETDTNAAEKSPKQKNLELQTSGASFDVTAYDLDAYWNRNSDMSDVGTISSTTSEEFDVDLPDDFEFKFNGEDIDTITIGGKSYIKFGTAGTVNIHYNSSGVATSIQTQSGTLDSGIKFFKIRYIGRTYNSTSNSYRNEYELFLLSNGDMILNTIYTPSSYTGTTNITAGSTYSFNNYTNSVWYFTRSNDDGTAWTGTTANYGTCGSQVYWEYFSNTGRLDIFGTGDMYNYSYSSYGWYSYRSNIKTVNIGKDVTSIGQYAFYNYYTSLQSVNFQDDSALTKIGYQSFYNCTSLTSIKIPAKTVTIESSAFQNCTKLSEVKFESGSELTTINGNAFQSCTALESITIPKSVTTLGQQVFYNCTKLSEVKFESGSELKTINNNAFQNCTSLKSIEVPDTVTSIGTYAFSGCTSLKSAKIPDTFTAIPDYLFNNCSSLTDFTFPSSVTTIGTGAFNGTGLKSLTLPKTVKTINNSAFANTYQLNKVTIGNDSQLTTLGTNAFTGGTKVISKVPANVTVNSNALNNSTRTNTTRVTAVINSACSDLEKRNGGTNWGYLDSLYISSDVTSIKASFLSEFLNDEEVNFFIEPNTTFTLEGNVSLTHHRYPEFTAGEYMSDSNGVLYRITDSGAYLAYCPPKMYKVTVPATIGGKKIIGVDSYAFAFTRDAVEVVFGAPKNITNISDFAFAYSVPSVTTDNQTYGKLQTINSKNVDEDIIGTFASNVKVGAMPFVNTKITQNTTDHTNKMIENGSVEDLEYPYMSIKTENENENYRPIAIDQPNGDYVYYTGQTAKTTISLSPQGSRGYKYYVYFKFLNHNGTMSYGPGHHKLISNALKHEYDVTVTDLGQCFYRMEFPVLLPGDTMELSLTTTVDTKTSGGYELIWGEVCTSEQEETSPDIIPSQYQAVEWRTVPKKFSISANIQKDYNSDAVTNDLKRLTNDKNIYTLQNSHFFTLTNITYTGINNGNYACDYATSVDYTDVFTLPDGLEWVEKYTKVIEDGTYWTYSPNAYTTYIRANIDGEVKDIIKLTTATSYGSTSYNGNGSFLPSLSGLTYDKASRKLTVMWTCYSQTYSKTEYPTIYTYINFGNDVIKVSDSVINSVTENKTLTVKQDATQVVHYSYSNDQTASASNSVDYLITPGLLQLVKNHVNPNTGTKYMGSPFEYTITASKKSGHTPQNSLRYIADDLPSWLYITEGNLEKMFYEDPYGEYLTLYITGATLCKPLSGSNLEKVLDNKTDGSEYYLSMNATAQEKNNYTGAVTSLDDHANYSTGNTITIKRNGSKLSVQINDDTPKEYTCTSGDDMKLIIDKTGLVVTSSTRYRLRWYRPQSLLIDDGISLTYNVRSTIKNTFMMIYGDKNFDYHSGGSTYSYTIDFNYAYALGEDYTSTIEDLTVNTSGYITRVRSPYYNTSYNYYNQYVNREAYIYHGINGTYTNTSYLTRSITTQVGNVHNIGTQFYNYSNSMEVTPIVNNILGTQVVLAPVAQNTGKSWTVGLPKYTYNGTEYYVLNKVGTYKDVYVGGMRAGKVEVSNISSGKQTLIYWYISGTNTNWVTLTVPTYVSPTYAGVSDYTKYALNTYAYMGDHEYHRLYGGHTSATFQWKTSAKKVITNKGSKPANDSTSSTATFKEGGENIYRLDFVRSGVADHPITFIGTLPNNQIESKYTHTSVIYDQLPVSVPDWQWSKNVNVKVQYIDEDGNDYTKHTFNVGGVQYKGIENPNDWYISYSKDVNTSTPTSSRQQYLIFGNNFRLNLFDKNVYIYVTFTMPTGETYTKFSAATGTQLQNRLSVDGYIEYTSGSATRNIDFNKYIVTRGETPDKDSTKSTMYIGQGTPAVTYRIMVGPTNSITAPVTLDRTMFFDRLPVTPNDYLWKKGVNVTNVSFVDKNGEDYSKHKITYNGTEYTGITGADSYEISTIAPGMSSTSYQQYMVWGNDFKLTIYDEPVYMYVTLKYPTGMEYADYVEKMSKISMSYLTNSNYLYNYIYVNGWYSYVRHTISSPYLNNLTKRIVTEKGEKPENDTITDFSYVGKNNNVTYRMAMRLNSDEYYGVLKKSSMYDKLPRTTESFKWSKDSVIDIKYMDANGNDLTKKKLTIGSDTVYAVTGGDDWYISDSSSSKTDTITSNQQYIVWGDSFKMYLNNEYVYIYVTLKTPTGDIWESFLEEQPNLYVNNYFYLGNNYSYVNHELAATGNAVINTGVIATGTATSFSGNNIYTSTFNQRSDSRLYYINNDNQRRTIDYYISVFNDGMGKLYLNDIVDILPEGFTYGGYVNPNTQATYNNYNDSTRRYYYRSTSSSSTTYGSGWTNNNYLNYNLIATITPQKGNTVYKKAYIQATTEMREDGRQQITFKVPQYYNNNAMYSYQNSTYWNNTSYDTSVSKTYLNPGEALVFTFSCYTNTADKTEDAAANRVAMSYYNYNNQGVELSNAKVTGNDRFASSKNDGIGRLYDNAAAMAEGFTGGTNGTQWLFSDVTVNRGTIQPGIVKTVDKVVTAEGVTQQSTKYASFTDKITWAVTVSNDGNEMMRDYTVTDEMQAPFRYLDSVTMEMTYPYTTQTNKTSFSSSLLTFNSWGDNNDTVTFTDYNGSHTVSTDGTWAKDLSTRVYSYIYIDGSYVYNYTLYYDARFTKQDNGNITVDFRFKSQNWYMAPGAVLSLKYTTQVPKGFPQQNKLFYNSAYVTPNTQTFDERFVTKGHTTIYTSVKDDQPSVKNSAQIPVSYGNVTSSFQKVELRDTASVNAFSYNDENYIVLPSSTSVLRYTLTVNSAQKAMKELIIIDNLPEVGDHETFKDDMDRYSEFKVNFADNPNVHVWIKEDNKAAYELDPEKYEIYFTTKTSFDDDDWKGTVNENWFAYGTDEYETQKDSVRSLRLRINDPSATIMAKKADVSVTFDAVVNGVPNPGMTAWNTFGYHFTADGSIAVQEAAPTELGIKLPSVPHLQKKLVDNDNVEFAAEEDVNFKFLVYAHDSVPSINSLTKAEDIAAALEAQSIDYTYCELNVKKDEYISEEKSLNTMKYSYADGKFVEGEEGFEWITNSRYTVLELPIENENYAYGNINNVPGNAYSFAYQSDRIPYITAVNKFKLWKLSVVKTDENNGILEGAIFGFYSPFEEDRLSDQEAADKISALSDSEMFAKPIETEITYEGKTFYLKDIAESPSNGTIIWSRLKMTDYIVNELYAPEGFRRDTTFYKVKGEPFGTKSITVINSRTLGYELPETGGSELYVYILGTIITAASMLLLYKKFRRRQGV